MLELGRLCCVIQIVVHVVFVVVLGVVRKHLSKQPQVLLLFALHRFAFASGSVFAMSVFVGIVHEVDQVRVVVLYRIPIQQDVLLTIGPVLLLLLNHLSVPLPRGVVVGELGLDFDLSCRVFRLKLLDGRVGILPCDGIGIDRETVLLVKLVWVIPMV